MTTKEMLEFYDGLIEDAISSGGDYGEFPMDPDSEKQFRLAAEPIRIALIEHGSEVSRKWVEQLVNLILNTGEEYVVDFAIKELREAGVMVKED